MAPDKKRAWEGLTSINQSSCISVSSARMRSVISKTHRRTYGVVRRHHQPWSTWPGRVEIASAYRGYVSRCVSSLCCEIQRSTTPKERLGETRRRRGWGRESSRLERQTARINRGKRGGGLCLVHVNTRLTIARDAREHDRRVHQCNHRALRVRRIARSLMHTNERDSDFTRKVLA